MNILGIGTGVVHDSSACLLQDGRLAAAAEEETEPAAESAQKPAEEEDHLKSKRPGPPIGGKSKVSKEYVGD